MNQHVQCRQFWVDERPHSTLFQCFNERRTAWQFRPQEKEKWRKFIHVREVNPGEISITREELRKVFCEHNTSPNAGMYHRAYINDVEKALFGPLPEGSHER